MKYTAGQAAKAVGVSKATITRALQSGKISGLKDDNGAWSIDPAELHRVFPPVAHATPESQTLKQSATPEKVNETGVLERENQMLREALFEARQERDRWHQIADRLSIAPPAPAPIQQETAESFWSRLFGKSKGT
jgi:DNA-binding MurR/RpiR family transcriptional regulator